MAYTFLEKMRAENAARFGADVGPAQPARHFDPACADLKNSALMFIHDRCEKLGFRGGEETRAEFSGKSSAPGQIPHDMEMDINRLCLERELERFIDSGAADDAYNVYYCYLEMFFGHYGRSKKMVELLSEYESNGSSLLMKHRDHYSHSVYVFALGLAIHERSEAYRRAFKEFYGLAPDSDPESDRAAACLFLEYWGLTSLFHDVGYPFELPFEQVLSYFEADGVKRGKGCVFIAYRDLDALTKLPEAASKRIGELYGREFSSLVDLLAFDVARTLGGRYGVTERELAATVAAKPVSPDEFGYYMDHAWFSAARLFRELVSSPEGAASLEPIHVNALSAILLHNSLFKFAVANRVGAAEAPLPMALHPLAYLLMLCDELQCWDRIAYGRNSRRELHPSGAAFDFTGGAIKATYFYDAAERDKIEDYERRCAAWRLTGEGAEPKLKAYGEMTCADKRFQRDIERIVDVSPVPLTVVADVRSVDRSSKHTYLSSSSFMHLYDFAVALNARYLYGGNEDKVSPETLEEQFESLSLEYQLSNINQAKSFAGYLNAIDCFYTDKPVDCEEIVKFSPAQTEVFAPMEHRRWVLEHISMGWTYGDEYETVPVPAGESPPDGASMYSERKAYREQMRRHKLTMDGAPSADEIKRHYDALPETEKGKDYEPFNSMLRLIKKFDGLRIYKLH